MVRMWHFCCHGQNSAHGWGTEISWAMWCSQDKRNFQIRVYEHDEEETFIKRNGLIVQNMRNDSITGASFKARKTTGCQVFLSPLVVTPQDLLGRWFPGLGSKPMNGNSQGKLILLAAGKLPQQHSNPLGSTRKQASDQKSRAPAVDLAH